MFLQSRVPGSGVALHISGPVQGPKVSIRSCSLKIVNSHSITFDQGLSLVVRLNAAPLFGGGVGEGEKKQLSATASRRSFSGTAGVTGLRRR